MVPGRHGSLSRCASPNKHVLFHEHRCCNIPFFKKARWLLFPGLLQWVEQEPPMDWVLPACRSHNLHFSFLSHCHYLTFPGSQQRVGVDGQEIR